MMLQSRPAAKLHAIRQDVRGLRPRSRRPAKELLRDATAAVNDANDGDDVVVGDMAIYHHIGQHDSDPNVRAKRGTG